jgi:predicted nuclease of restriction endonuclease-like (RecB) superfamily
MTRKRTLAKSRDHIGKLRRVPPLDPSFATIVNLIEEARARAYKSVNKELVGLYWRIGKYISGKLAAAEWGDSVVEQLARHLARVMPGLRGFTRRNLFRMRQFYDTYANDKKMSPLVTHLPWTHNLLILGKCKRAAEREFYLQRAIREKWGKRELERQLRIALFERTVLKPAKVSPPVTQFHPTAASVVLVQLGAL